jgi:surface protein
MYAMFADCQKLASIDVSNFNTGKVTNMSCMFNWCENLVALNVSNFDTRNVTDIAYMFYDCHSLKTLDVSNFNMTSCEDSKSMFAYCYGLNSLAVSFTMENLDEDACEYVGYFTPCTIIAPEGFDFGVDTSGSSFEWKSGKFTFGNSDGICPDQHHPHMIDLGLPSGKKWACCNVGASSPEKYGGFYAWGEKSEKNVYDWSTYIYCDGSWETCYDIGDDISGTNYDVAHVHGKWGGNWRMPNMSEAKELFSYCSHEETYYNGVNGYMFTGPKGNSIFIPAAGYKNESTHYRNGDYGALWLSTIGDNYYEAVAFRLLLNNPFVGSYSWSRNRGLSVRPIHP